MTSIVMRKRFKVLLPAFGLGLALTTGIASSAYGATPVVGSGTITCGLDGVVKFVPPLVDGGTTPSIGKFKGTLSGCKGSHTPAGITGGKVTGSFVVDVNDCTQYEVDSGYGSNSGKAGFAVKWKGSSKVAPTSATASGVGFPSGLNVFTGFVIPGFAPLQVTGSFAANLNVDLTANFSGSQLQRNLECHPKVKGAPITGGLKKAAFTTAAGSTLAFNP